MTKSSLILITRERDGERATLAMGAEPCVFTVAADPEGVWGFAVVRARLDRNQGGHTNARHPAAWDHRRGARLTA